MSEKQAFLTERSTPVRRGGNLAVEDIVRYLQGVARLQQDKKTGNLQLSKALVLLSGALRPYSDWRLTDLLTVLEQGIAAAEEDVKEPRKSERDGGFDFRSISQAEVQAILDQEDCLKMQLVDLGDHRFGISRSKLTRLRKEDARESIRAALENEKSLDVISREARRAGSRGLGKV